MDYKNPVDKAPPVAIGDVIEVEIIGIGRKGDGITRVDGYVIIVQNTKRGEKIKIEITQVLETFGFGIRVE